MTSLLEDLRKFQSKRKFPDWQPKANTGAIKHTHSPEEEVVLRCLAFVDLEAQVGTWIETLAQDSDNDELVQILQRNVADELKHDKAIRDLQMYYRYKENFDIRKSTRANALVNHWKTSEAHPVVNAYALEMGIFFTILPILMRCGDVYAAMVAGWINDDERVHVETNLRLMKHFKLKLTSDLVFLVYNTVAFIYEPFGQERATAEAERAVNRLVKTKDLQMLNESLPIAIAYFEQNKTQDIVYS